MVLAPDEVEAIFTVSLDDLMRPQTFRRVPWRYEGRDYVVPVFAIKVRRSARSGALPPR